MDARAQALNAICPYFTMFPLDFPLGVLARAKPGHWVLDPFSGRGTTNYAARLLGLPSIGFDSSPVAAALTQAKLANTSPDRIVATAKEIIASASEPSDFPTGVFWRLAFHPKVLESLCKMREALLVDCRSASRRALRAIVLGALHGPRNRGRPTYLSNQCPRTYAPKPRYAASFWRSRRLNPPNADVLEIIGARAVRYYRAQPPSQGFALRADSRNDRAFRTLISHPVSWVITSPPYYGMRTYIPDQWLRNWFVGGSSSVDYSQRGQLGHRSALEFAADLRRVWNNVASVSSYETNLVVRFGGISDRRADPLTILKQSLEGTSWRISSVRCAGSAGSGKRQSLLFGTTNNPPRIEYDVWAKQS